MEKLVKKLSGAVHRMFARDDLVVAGISGGPDSVALLDALKQLSEVDGFRLHLAHLDHGLRGPASTSDAEFVTRLAEQYRLPITIGKRDVAQISREQRLSLEEAARKARYAFFAQVVQRVGAVGVAVGHTADDQAETVVMHWLRGAGLAGLRGMQPVSLLNVGTSEGRSELPGEHSGTPVGGLPSHRQGVFLSPSPGGSGPRHDEPPAARPLSTGAGAEAPAPLRVYRPLLAVSRAEVEEYCAVRGLSPRSDLSNWDRRFRRNTVRCDVLPYLRQLNPKVDNAILRAAEIAAHDYDYLRCQAAALWPTVASLSDTGVRYDLNAWRSLHRSMQAYLLREGFARLQGNVSDLTADHLARGLQAMNEKPAGTTIVWPHGLRLEKRYGEFILRRAVEARQRLASEGEPIAIPGETRIGQGAWLVLAVLQRERCVGREADQWHADLDQSVGAQGLTVRRRRHGDRFQPLGMHVAKKLQDFLVDAKVPRAARDALPVVVNGGNIVWLPGLRIAEQAKVGPDAQAVLCLRFKALSP